MDEHIDELESNELYPSLSKRTHALFRDRAALAKQIADAAKQLKEAKDRSYRPNKRVN